MTENTTTYSRIGTFAIDEHIRAEIAWASNDSWFVGDSPRRYYAARLIIDGTEQAWLGTYDRQIQAEDAAYDAADKHNGTTEQREADILAAEDAALRASARRDAMIDANDSI